VNVLQAQVITGRINVVQNDAGNNTTSVTVTKVGGSDQFRIRTGSNRGDYNVDVGPSTFNAPANGVLLSCVTQNGRDETAHGETGGVYYAFSTTEITGNTYYIPLFQNGTAGVEENMNVAAAYFPFAYGAYGWLGAQVKNSANNLELTGAASATIYSNPQIHLDNEFWDNPVSPAGYYTVSLQALSAGDQASASSANGILLVTGGKNEDNYGMSQANADGSFTAICHNSSTNGTGGENDPVAFAYVPLGSQYIPSGAKDPTLLPMARIKGDGSKDIGQGNYTLTKLTSAAGSYLLQIPGFNDANGTLILTNEGGSSNNGDNICSYEWDSVQNGWVIQSRDMPGNGLQSPPATEGVFDFVFLPDNADVTDRYLRYDSGEWSKTMGGMWYDASSWSSGAIPSADGVEAKFGGNLAFSDTVTLDEGSTRMVGKMTFDNSLASYTIGAPGTTASVVLKDSAGTAAIDVQAGSHTINAGLRLTSDTNVTVAAGSSLALYGQVASGPTTNLTIQGAGTVQLGSDQVFTTAATQGNVTVNGLLDLSGLSSCVLTAGANNVDTSFAGVLQNTGGSVGLTKVGSGVLTLRGANLYSGPTTIAAGTVKLASTGSLANSPTITVGVDAATSAKLDLTSQPAFAIGAAQTVRGLGVVDGGASNAVRVRGTVAPGTDAATGVLTVSALQFDNSTGNTALTVRVGGMGAVPNDLLAVSNAGGLSVSGANRTLVNIQNLGHWDPQNTAIPLITYSGPLGGAGLAGFQLNTNYGRLGGSLADTGSAIVFNITQDNTPRWIGQASDNDWNATALNWKEKDSGLATEYRETPPDQVIFDDGADVMQTTVAIPGIVKPLNVVVNSSTRDYTFSGSGYISGDTSVLKRGTSVLTIETSNDFTGGMTIEGGTVVLTAGTVAKVGSDVTVKAGCTLAVADTISLGSLATGNRHSVNLDGGTLRIDGTDGYDFTNPLILTTNGGTLDTGSYDVLLNAPVTGELGTTFTKKGSGTLIMAAGQGGLFNQYIAEGTFRNLSVSPQSNSTVVTVAAGATFDDSYGNGEDFGGLAGEGTAIICVGHTLGFYSSTDDVFSGKLTAGTSGMTGPGLLGGLTRAGTGTTTLTGTDSDYGGTTSIRSGAIIVGANVAEGQNGPLGNATGANAVIVLGNTSGAADAGLYINTADVAVGRTINVQGGNTGVATVGGTNTSGVVTFSGNILLSSGDLAAKGASLSAADGGTVAFTGVIQVGGGVGTAFDITKTGAGKVVLAGANTYPGVTNVNAGILSVSADGNLGAAPATFDAAHLVLSGGALEATASFTMNANRGVKVTGTGGTIGVADANVLSIVTPISGDAGLDKAGTGTLVLTAAPTYTGTTVIENGVLSVDLAGSSATFNTITGSGQLHVGSTTTVNATSIAVDSLTIGGTLPTVAAVPEPSSIVLITLAGLGILWTIRRRFGRNV
jgi:autotransporter-associated beta strand protein